MIFLIQINGPDSIWKRKDQSRRLKTNLENKKDQVTWEEKIHILFPSLDDHRNHVTGQVFKKNTNDKFVNVICFENLTSRYIGFIIS